MVLDFATVACVLAHTRLLDEPEYLTKYQHNGTSTSTSPKDHNAEKRTLGTTDELYISTLYFSNDEAARIKATMIAPTLLSAPKQSSKGLDGLLPLDKTISGEDALTSSLANVFEMRRDGHALANLMMWHQSMDRGLELIEQRLKVSYS